MRRVGGGVPLTPQKVTKSLIRSQNTLSSTQVYLSLLLKTKEHSGATERAEISNSNRKMKRNEKQNLALHTRK